jgi:glycine/D-amino acid oxidase-like deaminating enzyme
MVVAKAAKMAGVKIIEETPVTKVITHNGSVSGVETSKGTIKADYVVLCGGMWSRQIGADAGVSVPLWPCEHEYVLTEPMPGCLKLPVIRTYDESLYIKGDAKCQGSLQGQGACPGGLQLWLLP